MPIRIVAGLGNPGRTYSGTRHNAGFRFASALAAKLGAPFSHEAKFAGDIARAGSLRIIMPATFMNESGRAVAALVRFHGVAPDELLVVHDELDLEPGVARLKHGGGLAGHNGLRDIDARLGSADFWRLRLGIGHPRDTDAPEREVVDYVLKCPPARERDAIDSAIERSLAVWPDIAAGNMEGAMQALNARLRERDGDPPEGRSASSGDSGSDR